MSEGSGGPFVWIFIFAIPVQNSLSVVKADTVCNSKIQNFTYTYPTSRLYVERKIRTNYNKTHISSILFSLNLSFNLFTIVVTG